MSYILYGDKGTGSFTAEAIFAELELAYEYRRIDLEAGDQSDDAFVAINPESKVPTLILPDGVIVTESAAILLALSARHPEGKLFPDLATSEGAWALRWLMFCSNNIYETVCRADFPTRYTSNHVDRDSVAAAAKSELRFFWVILERELAARNRPGPFVLGETLSALDIYVANLAGWENPIEWRRPNAPRIEAIRREVSRRPKIAPVWARHFDPVE